MSGDTPGRGEGRLIGGRYRLLRTLGAGGMGRVWLAYDEELACEVSMKEINLPDAPMDSGESAGEGSGERAEPGAQERIARARSEARNAARLRGHPHVATVHDVLMHEGLPWIVMEFVPDAVDLQTVVRRAGPLTPEQTARIGLGVLDALTAGHRIGILHRDVKPANILLAPDASGDPYARVLLTDYGIALQPESREPRLTATAGILGTPGYLSPERARGEPPTPAADMFSLGATLYATVEGRGPFDRHGEYATLTALLSEEPTPPQRAGELAPVLHGLLVKDPVRRFSPEAVTRGLERVLQSPQSPPGGVFGPPPGAVLGGGAAAAAAAAAAGGPAWSAPTPGSGPGTPGSAPGPGQPGAFSQPPGGPPAPQGHTPQTPHTPGGPVPHQASPGGGQSPGAHGPYQSWNPYASDPSAQASPSPQASPSSPYAGGGYPPYGSGSTAVAGLDGGQGGQGDQGGPGGRRRKLPTAAVVAIVVAVVLAVGGGSWAVVALRDDGKKEAGPGGTASPSPDGTGPSDEPTGPALPYGTQVGLTKPLRTGDCVRAVWPGTPFKSVPNLGVVDCGKDNPDGQVVAVDTAADYADARAEGARRCERQGEEIAEALPDADLYTVTPTERGFEKAEARTACLVLGRHAAIGGAVGSFREGGSQLAAGQMIDGDCWNGVSEKDLYRATLTDCDELHDNQVIGVVPTPANMDYKKGIDNASKLCSNKFESTWAPDTERVVYGWIADKYSWNQGFTTAVCTVSRGDGAQTSGKIPSPGAV
ncbi:serine/threonine protein kinase [Streptomyces dioscori]|uniref:non-specific serine/threonine protein kinase n=1 Tax=Streptomyces dioscori TaxID=2109333 RepID=A0A2P8Q5Y1_9ACTN|nr:serine/threonine-protein kinase [Streptomyces dioscori]PSM41645.1 serine/threonine protein kinase [Streptomyces dioscori]